MQTIVIVWLILAILASIFVVAALMLSSRISQDEGVVENYEDWEAAEVSAEVVQEVYPQQAEQ
jgi:hypothetical protein